jgi:hypothetical protein
MSVSIVSASPEAQNPTAQVMDLALEVVRIIKVFPSKEPEKATELCAELAAACRKLRVHFPGISRLGAVRLSHVLVDVGYSALKNRVRGVK